MMAGKLGEHKQLLIAALGISLLAGGCLGSNPKPSVTKAKTPKTAAPKSAADDTTASAEPDKVLYDRSMLDLKKGHYTEARLSLQTLINTYPDSEFLAKAKLAVADSFYKEGGTSNLTQSIDEYKNFIVFFPFLDEAAYAQMQVGMAHYHMMEKSDRDSTNAQAAEDDFQTFLLKYPTNPLEAQAEQHLRDVQEVLAEAQYKIARFYYVKQDFPASAARLVEMVDRYPLYSQSDEALWMLGSVYERAKQLSKNEDFKNHFSDLAAKCYDRIITDYPLSARAQDAKARLTTMGMAVPAPDPNAVARMQKEQLYEKTHRQNAVLKFPLGMVHSGPDLAMAAHSGTPNLNPPSDTVSATQILKPGSEGPTFSMGAPPSTDQNSGATDAAPIEAVSAGKDGGAPIMGTTVQIIDPPASDAPAPATTTSAPPAAAPPASDQPASSSTGNPVPPDVPVLAPSTPSSEPEKTPAPEMGTAPATVATPPPRPAPATVPAAAAVSNPPAAGAPSATSQAPGTPQPAAESTSKPTADSSAASSTTDKSDPKKESTSKKKKGLKKLIPW
jgi:outer membrane protein assembly factor BamD